MLSFMKKNIFQCYRFSIEQNRFNKLKALFHMFELMYRYVEIPFVEYSITTRCTLKCEKCSNLIPYFDETNDKHIIDIFKEINLFLDNVDYVYRFKVHGGEPLLHENLSDILKFLIEKDKIGEIRISTNGTIVPTKEILDIMKNRKILVFVSGYDSQVAPNRNEIIQLFKENSIRYRNLSDQVWIDTGDTQKRKLSKWQLKKQVEKCSMANCKALSNNFLYICSRAANGDELGIFNETEKLSINSINKNTRMSRYRKFYELKKTIGCMHCDAVSEDGKKIPPAKQIL